MLFFKHSRLTLAWYVIYENNLYFVKAYPLYIHKKLEYMVTQDWPDLNYKFYIIFFYCKAKRSCYKNVHEFIRQLYCLFNANRIAMLAVFYIQNMSAVRMRLPKIHIIRSFGRILSPFMKNDNHFKYKVSRCHHA